MILRVQDAVLQPLKSLQKKYLAPQLEQLAHEVSMRKPGWQLKLPEIPMPIQTVLIFKPDDIGDAVQSLPALRELRNHYPNAKLFLICQKKTRAIYEASCLLDEIADVEVSFRFVRFPVLNLKEALNRLSVKHFDVGIFLRTYSAYFSYFKKLPVTHFVHPKDPRMVSSSPYQVALSMHGSNVHHQSLLMLELISLLTRKSYSLENVVYPKLNFKEPTQYPGSIVVHPFVKYETKSFGEEKWIRLLTELEKTYSGANWVIIGGKEDPVIPLPEKFLQLQGKLSLSQTGSLLQSAKAFIGNESGPGHLASALGIPTITLMGGHSNPNEWRTLGKSLLLNNPVFCSPCHRRVCPGLGLKCLTEMTVEAVLPRVQSWLNAETGASPHG